jgi:hypothetical protein
MSFTLADLDALDAAIARGERTITSGDRSITYRSVAEMIQARNHIASHLQANAPTVRSRQTLLYHGGRGN